LKAKNKEGMMLGKNIENILKRVENRELTPAEAKDLIALEMKFEIRKGFERNNAKRDLFF
jgi:hypothetical protein